MFYYGDTVTCSERTNKVLTYLWPLCKNEAPVRIWIVAYVLLWDFFPYSLVVKLYQHDPGSGLFIRPQNFSTGERSNNLTGQRSFRQVRIQSGEMITMYGQILSCLNVSPCIILLKCKPGLLWKKSNRISTYQHALKILRVIIRRFDYKMKWPVRV